MALPYGKGSACVGFNGIGVHALVKVKGLNLSHKNVIFIIGVNYDIARGYAFVRNFFCNDGASPFHKRKGVGFHKINSARKNRGGVAAFKQQA